MTVIRNYEVITLDVGISTGFALTTIDPMLRIQMPKCIVKRTYDMRRETGLQIQTLLKADMRIWMRAYDIKYIIVELPKLLKTNSHQKQISAAFLFWEEWSKNASVECAAPLINIQPSQWKITPVVLEPFHPLCRPNTKHEEDALRIAYWWQRMGEVAHLKEGEIGS